MHVQILCFLDFYLMSREIFKYNKQPETIYNVLPTCIKFWRFGLGMKMVEKFDFQSLSGPHH